MSKKNGNYKDLMDDKNGIVRDLLTVFGFDPIEEHSFEAICQLEELIESHYPPGHTPLPTTLIPFGWYLTHTLQKNLPDAKINCDVKSIWDIHITYTPSWGDKNDDVGTMQVWPFKRVNKFWKNRDERMSAMLEMTMLMAKNNPESFQDMADGDGWVTLPSGTMFRIMMAESDKDGNIGEGTVKLNASKLIKGL